MTPDAPIDPRQALEASLTALLLGELPEDQAAFLRQAIASDAEMAKKHERLKLAIKLVRETEKTPAPQASAQTAPLKLAGERRQKLLQHFKTIAPKQFAPPRRQRENWLVPLAAALALLLILTSMLLPALSRAKSKSKSYAGRTWSSSEESASALSVAPPAAAPEPVPEAARVELEKTAPPLARGGHAVLNGVPASSKGESDALTLDRTRKLSASPPVIANTASAQPDLNFADASRQESLSRSYAAATPQRGISSSVSPQTAPEVLDGFVPQAQSVSPPIVLPTAPAPPAAGDAPANRPAPALNSNGKVYAGFSLFDDDASHNSFGQAAVPAPTWDKNGTSTTQSDAKQQVEGSRKGTEVTDGLHSTSYAYRRSGALALSDQKSADTSTWAFGLPREQAKEKARITELARNEPGAPTDAWYSAGAFYASPAAKDRLAAGDKVTALNDTATARDYFALEPDAAGRASTAKPADTPVSIVNGTMPAQTESSTLALGFPAQSGGGGGATPLLRLTPNATIVLPPSTPEQPVAGRPTWGDYGTVEKYPAGPVGIGGGGGKDRSLAEEGRGLYQMGKLNEAQVALGEALKQDPQNQAAQYYLNLTSEARYKEAMSKRDVASRQGLADVEKAGATPPKREPMSASSVANRARAVLDRADLAANRADEGKKVKPSAPAPIPQPEIQARENAFSTFSLNVSDVSFKLAAASLEKGALPEPSSVRSEEFINAFDYRDPAPAAGAPVAFAWERAAYPFAQNRDLLRFSLKTAAAGRQPGQPLNLVLLLDNSGSMERADRVRIRREALRVLAAQLQPQDKLSIITFARTAHLLADGIPGNQAARSAEDVGNLTPQGGTNLEEAMNLAYGTALRHYLANGINRVVVLTDGAANLGNVEPEALKQKVEAYRKQGIALDCFGIGWEGYNDDLLEVLSRNGDGRYGFINSPEEAATEFAGQLAGALKVAASDVKVQVEFNPNRVTAYRQIGYAKHQLKKEQFRDNTVDAAEIGAAESGNALYVLETNPTGQGPLATVRIRYKVPGTTGYAEQEWAVPYTGNACALEQASPAMRLAATAGAFSEWLASSPFAAEVNTDALLSYLRGVPETYGADARPKKLEWMLRQAKSIAGK